MTEGESLGELNNTALKEIEAAMASAEEVIRKKITFDKASFVYTTTREDLETVATNCTEGVLNYTVRNGRFFAPKIYPVAAIIHAIDHDLTANGDYGINIDMQKYCFLTNNPCLATSPKELIALFNKLRISGFGKRASDAWQHARKEQGTTNTTQDKQKPYTRKETPRSYYSLKTDPNTAIVSAYLCIDSFVAEAEIDIRDPQSSALFNTKTEIALGRNSSTRNFAIASPNLPTTAATITALVMNQVSLR